MIFSLSLKITCITYKIKIVLIDMEVFTMVLYTMEVLPYFDQES